VRELRTRSVSQSCSNSKTMEQLTEATICQLCREPIWNFLCTECLGNKVEQWIPKTLSHDFTEFHQGLQQYFHTTPDNYEPCLKCQLLSEKPICPHCYTTEVFQWMVRVDPATARNFGKIFFFYNFEGTETTSDAVMEVKEKEGDIGICDNCGDNSSNVRETDWGWFCETCRE